MAILGTRSVVEKSLLLLLLALSGCGGAGHGAASASDTDEKLTPTDKGLNAYIAAQPGLPSQVGGKDGSGAVQLPLHFERIDAERAVKLDGVLAEWVPLTPFSEVITGAASAPVKVRGAIEYDDTSFFVGAEVKDDAFYRSKAFKTDEDHVSLLLAFPNVQGGLSPVEIGLFAGKSGEYSGVVKFLSGPRKGSRVEGAKIVEAPTTDGYSFEAQIPWNAIPEARSVRVGMRGALRYYDADASGAPRSVVATAQGDLSSPATLPWVPTESESAMIEQVLGPNALTTTVPSIDILADVSGDGMKERVAVFGSYLTITGSKFLGGSSFFFRTIEGEVEKVDARNITGRGKDDLVIRRKTTISDVTRESIEVLSAIGKGEPKVIFSHEVAISSSGHRLSNALHIGSKQIEISAEPASGWDATTFHETLGPEGEALLLPWEGIKSQTFRFDGTNFTKVHEITGPHSPRVVATPAPEEASATQQGPTGSALRPTADMTDPLIALYRHERAVAADVVPRFETTVDLGGSGHRDEHLALFGRDLVIVGPGFKGGRGYAYFALSQFKDAGDIHDVSVRDLTGDGKSNVLVKGIRNQTDTSGATVESELLLVYKLRGESLERVFTIETARSDGAHRVEASLQFVPAKHGKGFDIEVRPGHAEGWTEQSYPWKQEVPNSGNASTEPLLLPWGGIPSVRYSWHGDRFSR